MRDPLPTQLNSMYVYANQSIYAAFPLPSIAHALLGKFHQNLVDLSDGRRLLLVDMHDADRVDSVPLVARGVPLAEQDVPEVGPAVVARRFRVEF